MKKVIAIVSLLLCVVIAFLALKLSQIKQQAVAFLNKPPVELKAQSVRLQLFPLALSAYHSQYQLTPQWQIEAGELQLLLDLSSIWGGDIKVASLRLVNGRLYSPQYKEAASLEQLNLTLNPTALWLGNLATLNSQAFNAQLAFYYKQQPYQLEIINAQWLSHKAESYQVIADELNINQARFEQVAMQFQPTRLYFRSQQANLDFYQQPKGYAFVGKNIDIETFWAALAIRSIIAGRGDLQGVVQFENERIPVGELHFEINQGQIKGINLLNLMAQYFPINVNKQQWQKRLDTPFNLARATMLWDKQQLWVKQFDIQSDLVSLQGNGEVALFDGQCDFHTQLNLNHSRYQKISLPLHFFGDCHTPQYKIEINKNLRNQFKEMLKQRLR